MSLSGNNMKRFQYHQKYSLHFKVSLIISEAIVILFFILSPNLSTKKRDIVTLDKINVIEIIPPTVFNRRQIIPKPGLPKIEFSSLILEELILDNVNIKNVNPAETDTNFDVDSNSSLYSSLSSVPRQILEVLPQQNEDEIRGSVTIRLMINEYGKVADYKILSSDLYCNDCIKNIVTAAYQSLWEPALIKGKKAGYWIEKTYNFN